MPTRRKDLNEATQQDLEQIPQMSSARAETIVHYRDQHGPFTSMEQLSEVPGIGATMAQQVSEFFSLRSSRSGQRATDDENNDEEDNGEDNQDNGADEIEGQETSTDENKSDDKPRRSSSRRQASTKE